MRRLEYLTTLKKVLILVKSFASSQMQSLTVANRSVHYMLPFLGFSSNEAAWIISEFGITAIVGKIVFGFLSQLFTTKDGHANTRLNTIGVTLSGIAIACAPWASSFSVLLVIGGAFGFMSGKQ